MFNTSTQSVLEAMGLSLLLQLHAMRIEGVDGSFLLSSLLNVIKNSTFQRKVIRFVSLQDLGCIWILRVC